MRLTSTLGIFISAVLAGCSSLEVTVDYDSSANFSKLRTWGWAPEAPEANRPINAPPDISPIALQRARSSTESILESKGFVLAAPDQADFLVAVRSVIERNVGYYYGYYGPPYPYYRWGWGYGWGPYWGPYWGAPYYYWYSYVVLIIDVVEPKPTRRLIWRGVARWKLEDGLTAPERDTQTHEAVQEALVGFPPGGGGVKEVGT